MQYKIPQNIDIEDKVIAGLTLRQFMFLLAAGGVGLLEYYFFVGPLSFLFLPIALVTAGVGIAFAFVKINDRPFEIFAVSAAKTLLMPRTRVWRKDEEGEAPKHVETKQTRKTVAQKKSLKEVRSSLEQLATIVDSGGTSENAVDETRQTNIRPVVKAEPTNLNDILAKTETEAPTVDNYMVQARTFVEKNQGKKEQTVGQMAKPATKPEDFKYDKLKLADEESLDATLKEVEERQKEKEAAIESAKVEKHPEVKKGQTSIS